jgi:hypothetical protein
MTSRSAPWRLRHGCLPKIRHATEEAAREHQESVDNRFGTKMDVYACEFCGGFHVGRPRDKK